MGNGKMWIVGIYILLMTACNVSVSSIEVAPQPEGFSVWMKDINGIPLYQTEQNGNFRIFSISNPQNPVVGFSTVEVIDEHNGETLSYYVIDSEVNPHNPLLQAGRYTHFQINHPNAIPMDKEVAEDEYLKSAPVKYIGGTIAPNGDTIGGHPSEEQMEKDRDAAGVSVVVTNGGKRIFSGENALQFAIMDKRV